MLFVILVISVISVLLVTILSFMVGLLLVAAVALGVQNPPRPQPIPQPKPAPTTPQPRAPVPAPPLAPGEAPTQAMLGVPIYPGAQFIASYDAGRGQRYYLFGTPTRFEQTVAFYKNVLKDKGELVFEVPPTHMWEVGRFREEDVAFPPGVTVKDYTSGGSEGFPNPKPGASPARFPTIIQIVPVTQAAR